MRRQKEALFPPFARVGLFALATVLALSPPAAAETDPPVITLTESGAELADGALFNRAVTPVVDVQDASPVTVTSELDGVAFTSGTAVAGEGAHVLSVSATDDFGNTASKAVTFTIDLTPPAFGTLDPADGTLTAAAEVTLVGQVTGAVEVKVDGVPAALTGNDFTAGPYSLAEGPRTWSLTATDAAGNGAARTLMVTRDSTPPQVSISQPAAGAVLGTATTDVTGGVSDAHLSGVTVSGTVAGITGGTYLAPQVPLAEGENTLVAEAEDAAGNTAQASRTVTLDTVAPTLAITEPAQGTVVPDATLTVRGTASDPHLSRVEVAGAAATLAGGTWSVTVALAEGPNLLTARAVDSLGHSTEASVEVTRDSTAPAVRITQPGEAAVLNTPTVEVQGTVDDEPGIAVTVNGVAATVAGGTFTAAGVTLAEGENRLIARVEDALGNQGAYTRLVRLDTQAPAFISSAPVSGSLAIPVDSAFALTFSEPMAEPAAGAWRLETAGGQAVPATATLAEERLIVRPDQALASATELALILTAGLTDLGGNALAAPQTLTFTTADIAAPVAPTVAPLPPAFLCAAAVSLAGTAEPEARVEVSGGAAAAQVRAAADGSFSLAVELTPGRLNRLGLTATDRAGNRSPATWVEVVHDCQAPEVVAAQRQGNVFEVFFSEAVDPASLVPGSVTLTDAGGAVAGDVAAAGTSGATFTPTVVLEPGSLRLEVTTAVRDRAGNALAYPFSRIFETQGTGFVAGTVLDAATGRPLGGAVASVPTTDGAANPDPIPEQTTGPDGRLQIAVAAGTHQLLITRPGYAPVLRTVTAGAGQGVDVLDPRLTPLAEPWTVGSAGGQHSWADGAGLEVPAAALAADTSASLTLLPEQGLSARLPYGWSPRGTAWLDLSGADLATTANVQLPVESPDGTSLVVVQLDLATLQYRVLDEAAVVAGGTITAAADAEGAYAAVEADTGPLAPPAPAAGGVLAAAPTPAGDEVISAGLTFDPAVVLPSQASLATVSYTLGSDAASGLPLTLVIREELQLLDGTTRREPPYLADLILYRSPAGAPRSRFHLQPSQAAQLLPLDLGVEDVTVRTYAGQALQGNVVGPDGGTVASAEGDRIDVPAGALSEVTPILLERRAAADLPAALPAAVELAGVLSVELGGQTLALPAALSLALDPPPAAGERGLLLEAVEAGGAPAYRVVATLEPTALGWTTAAIDPTDLPWPGLREGGLYAFARLTQEVGYLRGTVFDVGAAPLARAWVQATGVEWIQVSGGDGTYALPGLLGAVTASAENLATADVGSAATTIPAAEARVDLDLALQPTGPVVLSVQPADGATGVPPGVEPTLSLSEPLDLATLATGVRLLLDGADVPVTLQHQGSLVTVLPRATLLPGRTYELWVGAGLRDPLGNPVQNPGSTFFTSRDLVVGDGVDRRLIFLIAPDSGGQARIEGRPGAVPAGSLVFAENTTSFVSTPSVTAAPDGSFELSVEASLDDTLLLHILPTGGNEIVLELTPFFSSDAQSARVGAAGSQFTTGDGVDVTVPEGAFSEPTWVRVAPRPVDPPPVPRPPGFVAVYAFDLELRRDDGGAAEAVKRMEVTVPAPPGLTEGIYLLTRRVDVLGEGAWMMDDLMRLEGGNLTTEVPAASPSASAPGPPSNEVGARLGAGAAGAGEAGEAGESVTFPLAGPGLAARAADLAERAWGQHRATVPGMAFPGQYQVQYSQDPLGFVAVPLVWGFDVAISTGIDYMVAAVNSRVDALLGADSVWLPARLGEAYRLQVRDLTSTFLVVDELLEPPATAGGVVEVPVPVLAEAGPLFPVSGAPIRFYTFEARSGVAGLARGIRAELVVPAGGGSETLTLYGDADAADPDVGVSLLALDTAGATATQATTLADGSFTLGGGAAAAGNRYLLAVGAVVPGGEALRLTFSKAPDLAGGAGGAVAGLTVEAAGSAGAVPVETTPGGDGKTAVIEPASPWPAGKSYTLHLGPELQDLSGVAFGKDLKVTFRTPASRTVSTLAELDAVRDVARLGSMLFVAAGHDGLAVIDARDPANLVNAMPGGITFPLPLELQARGVAVDPHGRIFLAAGGVSGQGVLRIYDPLDLFAALAAGVTDSAALEEAFFAGNSDISDQLGSNSGSQLPDGTPHQVAVLSNDDTYRLYTDPLPPEIAVTPGAPPAAGASYTVSVTGTAEAGQPVTLRDPLTGSWARVDADAAGAFTVALEVPRESRPELLVNRDTLAYVAVGGVGVAVVDAGAFYNEEPGTAPFSDVLSYYTGEINGQPDPALSLCNDPLVGFFGADLVDLGSLFDTQHVPQSQHPLSLGVLLGFHGFMTIESDAAEPSAVSPVDDLCLEIDGARHANALEIVQQYTFDLDGDGERTAWETRDYALVGHSTAGVLILDVTDRASIALVGRIPLPGTASASQIAVDREHRRLLVAGFTDGLFVLDFDSPPTTAGRDEDQDGRDDRVLEQIALAGRTNAPVRLLPELGLAFAGGLAASDPSAGDPGPLSIVAFGEPLVRAVRAGEGGRWQPVDRLAPLGVPDGVAADGSPLDLPAAFRVLAALPGFVGDEVTLEVESLSATGAPTPAAGDLGALPGLPAPELSGLDGLVLRRLAADPLADGYHLFLSDEVVAVADLRASGGFTRTQGEDDACTRCDGAALGVDPDARELLSGDRIAVTFPAALRSQLASVYPAESLRRAELALPSTRWELSPAVRQEPSRNPSYGAGEAAPGTLLHSGEMTLAATDLGLAGRGFDFAFSRTYRSQTVGSGPLGPGWDHGYRQRLRELPNGDVELYDGRGRREVFTRRPDPAPGESAYEAPPGRFEELTRTATGWVLIGPHFSRTRFDGWGRLVSVVDAVKDSDDTGNEMRFAYDADSRLAEITDTLGRAYTLDYDAEGRLAKLKDFDGREVSYTYDAQGRLATVTSPAVTVGQSTFPEGVTTTYAYAAPAGDLAGMLTRRDDLASVTDGKGQTWLEVTFTDRDADGRAEEVTGQTWGGQGLTLAYSAAGDEVTTTVTDRRGEAWVTEHNADGQATSMTDPSLATTTYAYDAEGLLASRTEPLGRVTTYTYDEAGERRSRGNLTQMAVTADGRGANGSGATLTTTWEYEARTNRPTRIVDPRGAVTLITRDGAGLPLARAVAAGAPEAATTAMTYNAHGQLETLTNANGHATRYEYFAGGASEGYLKRQIMDPGGLGITTTYETDARGNVTATVDPRGVRHEAEYNELDRVVESRAATTGAADGAPALGYASHYAYDANGNLTEHGRPYGDAGSAFTKTLTTYGMLDEVLSVAREVEPGGAQLTTTYTYDANLNPLRLTDPAGHVTHTTYDGRNLPVSVLYGEGAPEAVTESFTYDADGARLTHTDGRGHTTTTAYDGYGRVAASVDPLGNRTELVYDDGGNVTESLSYDDGDTLLAHSAATYDLLGRRTQSKRFLWSSAAPTPRELMTTTVYDPAGNVITVSDPLGRQTHFAYDAAERLISSEDAKGNQLTTTLNATGQPETTTLIEVLPEGGPVSTTTTHRYDALGREVATTDALGNTVQQVLDARGNVRLVIDAEGHLTERTYDGLDRLLSETRSEGIRIEMGYDADGNLTSYRDARGNTTTWGYDALERVTRVTYPDATSRQTAYDAAGNPITLTHATGTVVTQSFDAASRLTGRSIARGSVVVGPTSESFSYDGLDRLSQAVSGSVTTQRTYDSLSRLTSETTAGKTVSYQLDDAGNVTGLSYPSGTTVTRTRDELNRLETIPGVAGYKYRGPDRVAEKTVGALEGKVSYDGARRPTSRTLAAGTRSVYEESLSWSARSLLKAQSRRSLNHTAFHMEDDKAGRLVKREHKGALTLEPGAPADGSTSFVYDAAENLVERREVGVGEPMDITSTPPEARNRPSSLGGVPLQWDANGNLTHRGDLRLSYDWRDRLTRVGRADGTEIATYTYDAFNRLVSKTAGSTTETTVWSGWQPIETYRGGLLHERRTFGLGLDELVRFEIDLDGDGALEPGYTPLYDQPGNLVALANAAGEIVERYEYSPYGFRIAAVDSIPPEILQLLYRAGELQLNLSEEILRAVLTAAADPPSATAPGGLATEEATKEAGAGTPTVSLSVTATGEAIPVEVSFPVELGRFAFRQARIAPTGTPPAAGTEVTLRIEAEGLQDLFFNQPAAAFEETFAWPAAETVLRDNAAPQVEEVLTRAGHLEIAFSEEVDLATAQAAIQIDGAPAAWELDATGYRLTTVDPLDPQAAALTIGTGVVDLAGTALPAPLDIDLTAPIATADPESAAEAARSEESTASTKVLSLADPDSLFFRLAEAGRLLTSSLSNRFGFHGREHHFDTGFIYFRNRWYDPEMGRFLSADPLGYVDGPSMYAFAGNSPVNYGDPLGLKVVVLWYGRGSNYGLGEGFDGLTKKLITDAKERGEEYQVIEVRDYSGETWVQDQSAAFSGDIGDLKIYVVSNASRTQRKTWSLLEAQLERGLSSGEELFLVGHSLGAVHQEGFAHHLNEAGFEVTGFVSVDRFAGRPTLRRIPANVRVFLGFYSDPTPEVAERRAKEGSPHFPGSGARRFRVAGTTVSHGVLPVNETHQSIDSSPLIHEMVRVLVAGKPILPMIMRTYRIGLKGSTLDHAPSEVAPERPRP